MDLQLNNRTFIVGGATSGFGLSITKTLIAEGATVIAIARTAEKIRDLEHEYPNKVEGIVADITKSESITLIKQKLSNRTLDGLVINAGGPPAKQFVETTLNDWDMAYHSLLRWKVDITQTFLPIFIQQKYGRILYIESVSVKQPIENLVLSTSLRSAVVGFVKTLSHEIAQHNITLNILAPGYHATPAMDRLFAKQSDLLGITIDQAKTTFEKTIPIGRMGKPDEFAILASWLLSPLSAFITGQTISVDGGLVKGIFG